MTTVTPRPAQIVGRHTADDGLFGPSSITWQLHAEPSMALVGIAAATTQMLHPRVMRMIDQASAFRAHPESRGYQTYLYMMTITYGDVAAAQRAGATLRRIHQAVKATDAATGHVYNAEEPDLLIWVQNTLTYCSLSVFSDYAPKKITPATRDQYVVEQKIAGELIGMDPADLPSSYAELEEYIDRMLPQLATIPEALWFRDMMTSRPEKAEASGGGTTGSAGAAGAAGAQKKQKLSERVVGRMLKDEALMHMVPVHRELFGVQFSPWRRFTARVGTSLMMKAVDSKMPTGAAVAKIREMVDVEAFGSARGPRGPRDTHRHRVARPRLHACGGESGEARRIAQASPILDGAPTWRGSRRPPAG
jgi:uncharacterized protein (DUF2236 family)